jgi:hypothetical protein
MNYRPDGSHSPFVERFGSSFSRATARARRSVASRVVRLTRAELQSASMPERGARDSRGADGERITEGRDPRWTVD